MSLRKRSIDFRQLGLIKQSNRVDTRIMLLIVDVAKRLEQYPDEQLAEILRLPLQGGVTPTERLTEGRQVALFWDDGLLQAALEFDAPWHSLVEAARDESMTPQAREEFFAKIDDFLVRNHRWPQVGTLRQWRGRPSNHRAKGDVEGQSALSV